MVAVTLRCWLRRARASRSSLTPFQLAKLANKQDIGCIVLKADRLELFVPQAVVGHGGLRLAQPDLVPEQVPFMIAHEHQAGGLAQQQFLGAEKSKALRV